MLQGLSRGKKMLTLLLTYVGLAIIMSLFTASSFPYGLSTVLGTSLLATTMVGSSPIVLSLIGNINTITVFSDALVGAQIIITLSAIILLAFAEVSNPTYGKTEKFLFELRKSWMPILAFVLILFGVTISMKILTFQV